MLNILINAFKITFLLGFLIFIHEGGHFLAARLFKVKVEAFSIGFGPKIFVKKGKETEYSLSLIPFGGYVKMVGEEERSDSEGAFNKAKIWHRISILAAGAAINIIFAIIVYFILVFSSGYNISTVVKEIIPEAKENISEIEVGDQLLEINNKKIRIKSDILKSLKGSNGEDVSVVVLRNNEKKTFTVTPTKYNDSIYILGVQVSLAEDNLKNRLYYSFWETANFTGSIGESLKMLFTGKVGVEQMTGPIGISEVVVSTNGVYDFIYLLCVISMSLGVTNLLPIPALDGGRIFLLIIEGIRGKALKEEIELGIQTLGFTLLILFSLYVSYNDILRIF